MNLTVEDAYTQIKEYFSRPDAVIARRGGWDSPCAYRTEDGNKCAIGCLIPDDKYLPTMEGWNTGDVLSEIGIKDDRTRSFLRAVQVKHDRAASVPQFLEQLEQFAADCGVA